VFSDRRPRSPPRPRKGYEIEDENEDDDEAEGHASPNLGKGFNLFWGYRSTLRLSTFAPQHWFRPRLLLGVAIINQINPTLSSNEDFTPFRGPADQCNWGG
jgi:hypothetical protein